MSKKKDKKSGSKWNVTAVRIMRTTINNAYVRFDGDNPVIRRGEASDDELLISFSMKPFPNSEEMIFAALALLDNMASTSMLLSASRDRGVEITASNTVRVYHIEVCVKGRWRQLNSKKAQRAIDEDIERHQKKLAKAEAEAKRAAQADYEADAINVAMDQAEASQADDVEQTEDQVLHDAGYATGPEAFDPPISGVGAHSQHSSFGHEPEDIEAAVAEELAAEGDEPGAYDAPVTPDSRLGDSPVTRSNPFGPWIS